MHDGDYRNLELRGLPQYLTKKNIYQEVREHLIDSVSRTLAFLE